MTAEGPRGRAREPAKSECNIVNIAVWHPEDEAFWEACGRRIALRNLCISTLSLFCGLAVWAMWGVITVQMFNLGFPFKAEQLFTLEAISGIAGASLRIPSSFLIHLAGGRNTIFLTTALLLVPALGTGLALQDRTTPLWLFQFLALLSGIGAGSFASSMSNIGNGSTFRTITIIFDRVQAGPFLGWVSAVAAYGAFIAPIIIGRQIKEGAPEVAMYGLAGFCLLCLVLNWWLYLRRGADIRNP